MDYEHYQAINTLIKQRINCLEIERIRARLAVAHHSYSATPDTEEGKTAYAELNKNKNRLRAVNQKLRKWRSVHAQFKDDMGIALDDKNSWVRINASRGMTFLANMLSSFGVK